VSARAVRLAEAIEDVRKQLGADPLSAVDHLDPGVGAGALEVNPDAAAALV